MWFQKEKSHTVEELEKTYTCPLCGHSFTLAESDECKACPKFMRCSLVMCPNCSHEFPATKRRGRPPPYQNTRRRDRPPPPASL